MTLDLVFKRRFHGAVNIKGIDFQILYTLYEGLLLIVEKRENDSITLEGIEDVDLKPFNASGTFVQVKTSDEAWHWDELQKIIPNFAEVLQIDPDCKFKLVVNFSLRQRITQLLNFNEQPAEIQRKLLKDFEKLCQKANVDSSLALSLINKLSVYSISKAELIQQIKQLLIHAFSLHPEATETYLLSFAYQFIDWAIERKTITAEKMKAVHIRITERLQRKQQFEAYGKYLIGKIDWSADKQMEDYFSGKRTRPGHITLGLDVERTKWLDKIDMAFAKKQICIIKAASGEGKSTLALRYVYKNWLPEYTYIIHSARTRTDAEEIISYLSGLSQIGLPVSVLLDDVREEISYYSEILAGCAANGIKALVTIRNEDYERFSSWNLTNLELVIPGFELTEARALYKNLKQNGRIHKDAPTAESAFEQIGSSATLIEYIYLITQGEMLEERLREQVRVMRHSEKKIKVELLRQLAVAHSCRVSIDVNRLLTAPDFSNADIQGELIELTGEYISIDNNRIDGYHWVRSNHLVKILHEKYANVAVTGLKVLAYLEEQFIPAFIENLLALENADEAILIDGLYKEVSTNNISHFLDCVNGLFKGGERLFFIRYKHLFDEAYRFGYQAATSILSDSLLPTIHLDTVDTMINISGERGGNYQRIKELNQQIKNDKRGFQLVTTFLQKASGNINQQMLLGSPELLGELLDWLYWCQLKLPAVDIFLRNVITSVNFLNLPLEAFCMFSQGFYRYDEQKYKQWFAENKEDIIMKLEEALDCEISISGDILDMTYSTMETKEKSWNNATMYRINRLRSAIPFCSSYKGNRTFVSMVTNIPREDNPLAHNDSLKNIKAENLYFRSDVAKNQVIIAITEDHYQIKTRYDFFDAYYQARVNMFNWVEYAVGIMYGKAPIDKTGKKGFFDFNSLKRLPDKLPEKSYDDELNKLFKYCHDCFRDFTYAAEYLVLYSQNNDNEKAIRLSFLHYNNFMINLPYMQEFFERTAASIPDNFDFSIFPKKENNLYEELKKGLQLIIKHS